MQDLTTNKRVALLRELIEFHRVRLQHAQAFAGEVLIKHHRERMEKMQLVLQNIERYEVNKQTESID
jgi:hypothetical protein